MADYQSQTILDEYRQTKCFGLRTIFMDIMNILWIPVDMFVVQDHGWIEKLFRSGSSQSPSAFQLFRVEDIQILLRNPIFKNK